MYNAALCKIKFYRSIVEKAPYEVWGLGVHVDYMLNFNPQLMFEQQQSNQTIKHDQFSCI